MNIYEPIQTLGNINNNKHVVLVQKLTQLRPLYLWDVHLFGSQVLRWLRQVEMSYLCSPLYYFDLPIMPI